MTKFKKYFSSILGKSFTLPVYFAVSTLLRYNKSPYILYIFSPLVFFVCGVICKNILRLVPKYMLRIY